MSTIPSGPRWEDAFDPGAELLCILHPKALERDAVYGPLLRRASLLAAAESRAVAATRALDVIEGSEEVLISMRTGGTSSIVTDPSAAGDADVMIVLRGVRADIDPQKVVDSKGTLLWRAARAQNDGPFAEYLHDEYSPERGSGGEALGGQTMTASLFVLPGRTWVIATGPARSRGRDAFTSPSGRPTFRYDAQALVSIKVDGPSLLAAVPKLRSAGQLSSIGSHLQSVLFALQPGAEGTAMVDATYDDEEPASVAELTMRRVVEAVRRTRAQRFWWMTGAEIHHDDPLVVSVKLTLPASLLTALSAAQTAPIDDHDWPAPDDQ